MTAYTTLNNEKLSLDNLSKKQKELLRQVYDLFKEGAYMNLINFSYSPDVLEKLGAEYKFGGYWVDEKVRREPLYKIVEDLETRLAINTGKLSRSLQSNVRFEENEKVLEEYLNTTK